jgi:hypothetical protein
VEDAMSVITPERYMLALRKTPVVLNALLKGVSQEQAERLTDGPGGWSVVETMCHIRDFADVSLQRAQLILAEDQPLLPNLDPLEAARRRDYPHQALAVEFDAYLGARRALVTLLGGVTEAQWARCGTHSAYGSMSLLELLVFITWHDLSHIEQVARTLGLSEALL